MDITIHSSFLPHNDPDASLAFYRDTLGFEIRPDRGELAIAIGLSISGLPVRLQSRQDTLGRCDPRLQE
jgi:catechol 2,3-dioxygenase-like lactoylglutathione lyase family enzyme